jgi:general secretion pathway protein K
VRPVARAQKQRGYILALNLAVLALMMLLASFVGQRVFDAVRLARAEQQAVDRDYALESARAKLLLLLATSSRTAKGLVVGDSIVSLDGRSYAMDDAVIVSFQDSRGLVSVNGLPLSGQGRVRFERLLRTWGVTEEKAAQLTDALLDYRDEDDLRRLNGAETVEYRSQGREAELRNQDLLSLSELARVWGWRETKELWGEDPISDHLSLQRGLVFNPNTAGWRALVAMAGVDPEAAKSIVSGRQGGDGGDISKLLFGDGIGDPFGRNAFVNGFPGPTLVVTFRVAGASWAYRMIVSHIPAESTSPWRISGLWRVPMSKSDAAVDEVPKLPLPPMGAASQAAGGASRPAGQIKLPG